MISIDNKTNTATITTTCICTYCDICGISYATEMERCDNCGDGLMESNDCYDCYTYMLEDAQESVVSPWIKKNKSKVYDFTYRNLGWNKLSGTSSVKRDNLINHFTGLNSDWKLVWSVNDDGALKCVRYHHDVPTGETFVFSPRKKKK